LANSEGPKLDLINKIAEKKGGKRRKENTESSIQCAANQTIRKPACAKN
jgi:hypothetical protein